MVFVRGSTRHHDCEQHAIKHAPVRYDMPPINTYPHHPLTPVSYIFIQTEKYSHFFSSAEGLGGGGEGGTLWLSHKFLKLGM